MKEDLLVYSENQIIFLKHLEVAGITEPMITVHISDGTKCQTFSGFRIKPYYDSMYSNSQRFKIGEFSTLLL